VVLLFLLDGQVSMPLLMVAHERPSYDRCAKISEHKNYKANKEAINSEQHII